MRGKKLVSVDPNRCSALDMVAQLLERSYTAEQIATELSTSVRRVKALINELERRSADNKGEA